MYEFDKYESRRHDDKPVEAGAGFTPVGGVDQMSMLIWSEHCIECAIPACYKTCDLYQARPDLRCRRFTYGLYKNPSFSSVRPYGAEVSFKKWGKLETRGNTRMLPVQRLRWAEAAWSLTAPILNCFGALAFAVTRDIRWRYVAVPLSERLCRRQHRRKGTAQRPDAFLLEVYNPAQESVRLMIEISVARIELKDPSDSLDDAHSFTTTVELEPGYSRHQLDARLFESVTESGLPFDVSLIPEEDRVAKLVFMTSDFVIFKPTGGKAAIKCVVWDLDNTLWTGVLVEGDDVKPRDDIVNLIKSLDERGVLNSIASKNDHAQAWETLQRAGIDEYFLHPQIGWDPKSIGIKRIAEQLNIGLDTFAFVDDSEFELEEVRQALPAVTCIDASQTLELTEDSRFQGSSSADAGNRRRYYRDAIVREQALEDAGGDYLKFLASCEIVLAIRPFKDSDAERVAELVQRTNQLNFSGRKYARQDLQGIVADPASQKYVLDCDDRFGSYGTVGFSIVRRNGDSLCIDDFMLSCRVQGKRIEQAFFSYLAEESSPGLTRLLVNFHPTERNKPALRVLEDVGFRAQDDHSGYSIDIAAHDLSCDFIKINPGAKPGDG
ncbi:MAG: HAD-IIIC family phosphatase [Verrucomicrobia bacterium]|nr:HAD-IIIC family phosphatase [Verrucomicrobiota bacterium]MDA1087934.1 HAD-IIIC family phosphatase [Verrucomicrobiota bacterium]